MGFRVPEVKQVLRVMLVVSEQKVKMDRPAILGLLVQEAKRAKWEKPDL